MNYRGVYNRIIERGKDRDLSDFYSESHHIIPKCMNGNNDKDNLVDLTPEEHYLAHQLLAKIYPNNHKLSKAAAMMVANRPTNKLYGWLRRRISVANSISQTGEGNSQYGTMWITNGKNIKKINKTNIIPDGWFTGRLLKKPKPPKKVCIKHDFHVYLYKKTRLEIETLYYWNLFNNGEYTSIRHFCREVYPKSHVMFTKLLKLYVNEEYNPKQGKRFIGSLIKLHNGEMNA